MLSGYYINELKRKGLDDTDIAALNKIFLKITNSEGVRYADIEDEEELIDKMCEPQPDVAEIFEVAAAEVWRAINF